MKKFISIILVSIMLVMTAGITGVAANENENLIFDVDFSNYDGTAETLADKAGKVTSFSVTGAPEAAVYNTADGSTVKYAKFSGNEKQYIAVENAQAQAILNNPETTLEFWSYVEEIPYGKQQTLFMITPKNYWESSWDMQFRVIGGGETSPKGFELRRQASAFYQYSSMENKIGKWNHYALTRSYDAAGKTVTYNTYLNSNLINQTVLENITSLNTDNSNIYFGGFYNADENGYFKGGISEIKMYDTVLTQNKIAEDYNEGANKYYSYDDLHLMLDVDFSNYDGTVETLADKAGKVTSFSVTGAPEAAVYNTADGSTVKYAKFSGNEKQYIAVENAQAQAILNNPETTLEFWSYVEEIPYGKQQTLFMITPKNYWESSWDMQFRVIGGGETSPKGFELRRQASAFYQYSSMENKIGKWNHYALTRSYDAAGKTVTYNTYLNSNLINQTVLENITSLNTDNSNIYFGGFYNADENGYFKGGISEIKMYDTVLTQNKIAEDYNEGANKYYSYDDLHLMLDIDFSTWSYIEGMESSSTIVDRTGTIKTFNVGLSPAEKKFFNSGNNEQIPYAEFTGVKNQRLVIAPNSNGTALLNKPQTSVELWFKPQFETGRYPKFFQITNGGQVANRSWWAQTVSENNGTLSVYAGGTELVRFENAAAKMKNQWCHLILTREFNENNQTITYNMYLDGELLGTKTLTEKTEIGDALDDNICFGGSLWGDIGDLYTGGFAEVKMYNSVLTQEIAASKYAASANIYKPTVEKSAKLDIDFSGYDEITGIGLKDNTGFSKDFNVSEIKPTKGEYDNGLGIKTPYLHFNGADLQYVGFGAAQADTFAAVANKDTTTLEMWLRTDKSTAGQTPFALNHTVGSAEINSSWRFDINEGSIKQFGCNGQGIGNAVPVEPNKWVHLVLTRDFNADAQTITYKTFLNGKQVSEQTLADMASVGDITEGQTVPAGLYFGNSAWDNNVLNYFSGDIAKIKMYDMIMNEDSVKRIYESEKNKYVSFGTIKVTDITYFDYETGDVVNSLAGLENLYAEVKLKNTSSDNDKKYFAAAALYDGSKLVKLVNDEKGAMGEVGKGGKTADLSFLFENIAPTSSSYVRIFVWSADKGEEMTPYSSADGNENVFVLPYAAEHQEGL